MTPELSEKVTGRTICCRTAIILSCIPNITKFLTHKIKSLKISNIQFINHGFNSIVFSIEGNKVLKLTHRFFVWRVPDITGIVKPASTHSFLGLKIEIFEKKETLPASIDKNLLYQIQVELFNRMLKQGYIFVDIAWHNIGKTERGNYEIIDAGAIRINNSKNRKDIARKISLGNFREFSEFIRLFNEFKL